jgi:hypothetical protein
MPRKSWQEKLADDKDLPKVFRLTGKTKAKWGAGTMVIPAPREVDAVMRSVPRGKLITINEIPRSRGPTALRSVVRLRPASSPGLPLTPRKKPLPRERKRQRRTGAR